MDLNDSLQSSQPKRSLPAGEMDRVLRAWNATDVSYDNRATVIKWISEQAKTTPRAVALSFCHTTLTYAQLEDRSQQLAHYLVRSAGVGPTSIVSLLLERSIDMVVSILAVLRTGAAYLPLNPTFPHRRLSFMLSDARSQIVLAHSATAALVPPGPWRIIRVDADWPSFNSEPAGELQANSTPESLAYVIYTSGSTGLPKGVMIPHSALTNHMLWMREAFPLGPDDVVLQKTPLSFDASVWEILAPLMSGAKLVLAEPEGHRDPVYLTQAIREHNITTLQVVPSMLRLLLQERCIRECISLKNVFSGGEVLTASIQNAFFERLSAKLHNLYGPTETCIQSIVYSCQRAEILDSLSVPIGRPIANTQVYVLDKEFDPVPVGVEGELYIGGAGLARGYLGREELTRECFIPNPFGAPNTRLYRTGDRVRYREDGNLEYLGRRDEQVKVGGYRIELGEIEAALLAHPRVLEAAVVVLDDGAGFNRLAAYVVGHNQIAVEADELRRYLSASLPDYMVPPQVLLIAQLPRLPSGKVDRQALAGLRPLSSGRAITASMSPIEHTVATLCAEVLEVDSIGLEDDFFDLGGSSLQLLYVMTAANTQLRTSVQIEVVSQGATIGALASYFESAAAQ